MRGRPLILINKIIKRNKNKILRIKNKKLMQANLFRHNHKIKDLKNKV